LDVLKGLFAFLANRFQYR